MSRSKYEVFNISTGKMEEGELSSSEFFDQLAANIADQSQRLYDIYKAEREIVESIIDQAALDVENRDRSTD